MLQKHEEQQRQGLPAVVAMGRSSFEEVHSPVREGGDGNAVM